MADRITAVFDNEEHAEMAVKDLRGLGITDDRLSIVARHREGRGERRAAEQTQGRRVTDEPHGRVVSDEGFVAGPDTGIPVTRTGAARTEADYRGERDVSEEAHEGEGGSGVGRGLAAGAGIGAIFGLAATLIPGIGPFIAAGFLANLLGATAGAIVSGAIVGGTAGAVAGALARAGYSEDEAAFYGDVVERGGVLVAVDMAGSAVSHEQVRRVLADHGGHFHGEESARRAA